jgi:bifunctional N-acetylglucosamine-1-phosphate-uridyltransferase/glucosamine-1-phosphate-acetyltransferase GlmU-like protein
MTHIITLSGNSKRFTDKGFPHKALCEIRGETVIRLFVEQFKRFDYAKTIFLCRNEDLESTSLAQEIKTVVPLAQVYGIESNKLGPVYSISRIFDKIDDEDSVLITYIDSVQKIDLSKLEMDFNQYDGGITLHDFHNPHWRVNKSFCLVTHDSDNMATKIMEKYDFSEFDFSSKDCGGSSGSYYFNKAGVMKSQFNDLMNKGISVNNEYYVTQVLGEMISMNLKIKCAYYPYVCLGTPEDVQDFRFWTDWFRS